MDENIFIRILTMCFYYLSSPEDKNYLVNRMNPFLSKKRIQGSLTLNTLAKEAPLFSSAQKLLLMTYSHMYILLRDRNLLEDTSLKQIRQIFSVSEDFVAFYMRSMRRAHYRQWIHEDNLLECILNPCEDFRKWAEDTTFGAIQEGCRGYPEGTVLLAWRRNTAKGTGIL
ncbi:hypothetical protein Dred_0335 [Desulforamulus reducens MI-1]|uniref:Uncharacterized protein n=1 Tax=Desulforamulus reducens (strain ATCC BAA-1160 / DSM 100696 / MI-1) TaxID=349161 RepID=A4J1D0_DESRM|nr:hypothetical protein [Desulforamulus reducens]ABO48883.1 hypothetical protein Dred_0335 [Desulforamulus reducens MI-1]